MISRSLRRAVPVQDHPVPGDDRHVSTDKLLSYLKQPCRHFGHRQVAEWKGDSGSIAFDYGRCELTARDGDLTLKAIADDAADHERLEHVIASHLERFGARGGLAVTWGDRRS